jgi:hypothetical protein
MQGQSGAGLPNVTQRPLKTDFVCAGPAPMFSNPVSYRSDIRAPLATEGNYPSGEDLLHQH